MTEPMPISPVKPEPIQQTPEVVSKLKKPCCKKIIWLGIGVIVTALFIVGSFMYIQLKSSRIDLTISNKCTKDADCVLGIQTSQCCSCPQAVNHQQIGKNKWLLYESEVNYSSFKPVLCGIVACGPCPQQSDSFTCLNNQCTILPSASSESTDWKTYFTKNLGISLNYPSNWYVVENLNETKQSNFYALRIEETKDSWANSIRVMKFSSLIGQQNDSIEQFGEKKIQWEMLNLPGISKNSPELIKKEPINLNGLNGYKFLLKFNNLTEIDYEYQSEVFLYNQQKEYQYTIILAGDNQSILNQILSTFKFTE